MKICGVKNLDTALTAINAGASFLGFNFVHTSRNYIKKEKAKEIVDQIKGRVQIVGVFQNESVERVKEIVAEVGLDLVQLHGSEDNTYCQSLGKPVIKAFMIPQDFDVEEVEEQMDQYQVGYYMVDREKRGEGEILNPAKVKILAEEYPLFLAGGLTPENIGQILETVKPFAVDVSSGVETEGIKDMTKIKKFILLVKQASQNSQNEQALSRFAQKSDRSFNILGKEKTYG
ncbi:phosphoribosylanthranilate isomerase [Candidatus Daviesbacteria bacterium]|nr:phosphoribosylanthranilate isomerase [Candidatus Daviesbacteria bacterium]